MQKSYRAYRLGLGLDKLIMDGNASKNHDQT